MIGIYKIRSLSVMFCLGLSSLLSGCQLVETKPVVHVAGIAYERNAVAGQNIGVVLDVDNKNPLSIPISSGSATVRIDGQQFAHGFLPKPITLPSEENVQTIIPVSANVSVLEDDLPFILANNGIRYHITGNVVIHSISYPISYRGVITLHEVKRIIIHAF